MSCLRLILGDQLNLNISSLKDIDKDRDIILMCEVWDEATYVKHHKKKIAFIFAAMRHFADELIKKKYRVDYIKLDSKNNSGSFLGEVKRAIKRHAITQIVVMEPDEYRVLKDMQGWEKELKIPVEIRETTKFLCDQVTFKEWISSRKTVRMEYFYREMRKEYKILMDDDQPVGGQWNFDAENRKPPTTQLNPPKIIHCKADQITQDVLELVANKFEDHFGDLTPFYFAVTRRQALNQLKDFIENRLKKFGDYQDAMLQNEPNMFHSLLSFYLNCGLLDPLECIIAAEQAYHKKQAPINAVEAFIRQILGWREFIRGIYWHYMPHYKNENYLNAKRSLPEFFWTGDTKLNCLKQCITETKQNAYAHHIQRLMVLGNFLLLAGIDPDVVNEWYLIVYADAYEWVELPNVTGMILFADGGIVASKPYCAGGAYINKMSNYCKDCQYSVTVKNGDNACPFNYLYWNFLMTHQKKFEKNPRMAMMYRTLAKMSKEKRQAILEDSERFLMNFKKHAALSH